MGYDVVESKSEESVGRRLIFSERGYLTTELHATFYSVNWPSRLNAAAFIKVCRRLEIEPSSPAVFYDWNSGQNRELLTGEVLERFEKMGPSMFSEAVGFLRIEFRGFDLAWQVAPLPGSEWTAIPPRPQLRQNIFGFFADHFDSAFLSALIQATATGDVADNVEVVLDDLSSFVSSSLGTGRLVADPTKTLL